MTDLAEVIDVLRGHARSSTCTLEPRDCAALVAALERVRVEAEKAEAKAARFVDALGRYGRHKYECVTVRGLNCVCGLDAVFKETNL